MRTSRHGPSTALAAAVALAVAGCSGGDGGGASAPDPGDWDQVLAEADGQRVQLFMWGGDENLNAHVTGLVADRAAEAGVVLEQVRITDTVEAVNIVLGEKQAGRDSDGVVDLVWINGENFATGVQADLWFCDWARELPNARLVPWDDPTISTDFGQPVDGCEAPWNRAQSVVVVDSTVVPDGFADVDELLAWVEDNPGRFAYPAPPDFTGSMVVRTLLYGHAGGHEQVPGEFDEEAFTEVTAGFWERLRSLEPSLWRGGETYPQSQGEVVDLFANDQIDVYLTYDVAQVVTGVEDGTLPDSTRAAPLRDGGSIGNTNYVAIPYNSPDKAGAMVVADVMESVEAQLAKAAIGYAPVIDVDRTDRAEEFAIDSQVVPGYDELLETSAPELSAAWTTALEDAWVTNVLEQ